MVRGLVRLNSSVNNGHHLHWSHDPAAVFGYNIYRSQTDKYHWERINENPIPGLYYQDISRLRLVHLIVGPESWIDAGEFGQKVIRLPDIPYSEVQHGRPVVANSSSDVSVTITNATGQATTYRPAMVNGRDQTVFLSLGNSLPYGGAVSEFPIIDFDTAVSFTVAYRKLVNFVDISLNMARTFYCVVPIGAKGEEHSPHHPDTSVVDTMQVDQLDYMQAEMVRRNQWLFEQSAEPARLLLRRVAGERCHCTDSVDGLAKARTGCPVCYEQGIIGGYYGPFDMLYLPADSALVRTIDEGGQKVERRSKSYLSRDPIVQDGDIIIRENGERLVISGVIYKSPRGVLVQQEFDTATINPLDVRYNIPILYPETPIIYNPVYGHLQGDGAEPVFTAETVRGKSPIENPHLGVGRTVVFGNIQAPGWVSKKQRDLELP